MKTKASLVSALIASAFLALPVMAQTANHSAEGQSAASFGPENEGTAAIPPATPAAAHEGGQHATRLGTSSEASVAALKGWSVRHMLLGKHVHNDSEHSEDVGTISDIILGSDGQVAYAVVNASKFLGLSSHHVLIPIDQFRFEKHDRIVLPGSTKEALRELPNFEYKE